MLAFSFPSQRLMHRSFLQVKEYGVEEGCYDTHGKVEKQCLSVYGGAESFNVHSVPFVVPCSEYNEN